MDVLLNEEEEMVKNAAGPHRYDLRSAKDQRDFL